jgi:replication factor C small subunit
MLWTEKYRPVKLSQIVGQPAFVMDAEKWVENPDDMMNVLLYGVAGVGKTAAAIALANEVLGDYKNGNFFEINASDDRRLDTVRNQIKEIASTQCIGDAPFKLILLDEMDGMTKDSQNALKRIMERYADNCRFIMTANEKFRIIYPLQSRCANYRFRRITDENVMAVLVDILDQEGHNNRYTVDDLITFISHLHGDLRRGIGELQASINSDSTLTHQIEKSLEPYTALMINLNSNDHENSIEGVHKLIQNSVTMKEVCVNLHDVVLKTDMESQKKFKMLRVIGEAEWRSSNMTPKVLASWMIGQLV